MAVVDVLPPDVNDAAGPRLVEAAGAARSTRGRAALPQWVRRLAGPVGVLVLWQVLSATGALDAATLPPPTDVLRAGWELTRTGEIFSHLRASLYRVGFGLLLGVSVGTGLAVLTGFSKLADDLLDPVVQVARSVPVLALSGLLIVWFGVGEEPKVLLVALGTSFPIYLNTHGAIRGVDAKLAEAGRVFGLTRRGMVRHVVLPGALAGFLVGLRFALTGAWLILIFAEQINAREGVGALINNGRAWNRLDILIFGVVVYALLGLLADAIVRFLERRLLVWRRGFTGS